jgi:predicted transcriptional regulator
VPLWSAVQHVLSRFFNDSPQALMVNLLESETVDDAELERLRELIDAAQGRG